MRIFLLAIFAPIALLNPGWVENSYVSPWVGIPLELLCIAILMVVFFRLKIRFNFG